MEWKKQTKLLVIITASCVVIWQILSATSNQSPPLEYKAQRFKLDGSTETVKTYQWIDDQNILLGAPNQILIYDTASKVVKEKFPTTGSLNGELVPKCLAPERALFGLLETKELGGVRSTSETRSFIIEDPKMLATTVEAPRQEWWQLNTLDCRPLNANTSQDKAYPFEGESIENNKSVGQLIKSFHGTTEFYHNMKTSKALIRAHLGLVGNWWAKELELTLPVKSGSEQTVKAAYDRRRDNYLWYTSKSFSWAPEQWSIRAWKVSPALEIQETMELPAGPWVYPNSFLKEFSCFSCGCSCYEHMTLRMENGEIFAFVWGSAVNKEHRGVYKLVRGEPMSWKVIAFDTDEQYFALAPDGCSVAYTRKGQLEIVDTCKK